MSNQGLRYSQYIPTLGQSQTHNRGEMRKRSRQSAISPILGLSPHLQQQSLCRSRCTWYCTTLVPTGPSRWGAFEAAPGTWQMFLYLPSGHLFCCLEGTVACDTHITLLESDSGLSVHLLSDFMWLGACCHMTAPAIHFLPSSLRAHWPRAPGSGSCLSGNSWAAGCQAGRMLTFLISHREWECNLLLPGAHSEPLTSVWDEW